MSEATEAEILPSRGLEAFIRRERTAGRIVVIGPDGMSAAEIGAHTWMWCLLGDKSKGPQVVILARPNP